MLAKRNFIQTFIHSLNLVFRSDELSFNFLESLYKVFSQTKIALSMEDFLKVGNWQKYIHKSQ